VPDFELNIPNEIINGPSVLTLIQFVMRQAYNFYLDHPDLSREYLLKRAESQKLFRAPNPYSQKLEHICVDIPLSITTLQHHMAEYLSFDFACKFDYPKKLVLPILNLLLATNLYDNQVTSLSKYRLIKLQWEHIPTRFKQDQSVDSVRFSSFKKSMELKKKKDFVDCDLVHLVTVGHYVKGDFLPVVAFTRDDKNIVADRIATYKSLNATFVALMNNLDAEANIVYNKWKPGIVAFCDSNGNINDYLEVDSLPRNGF
jgi:hypothetical protein